MPAMDGTGPYGNGPMTGFGRGYCGNPNWNRPAWGCGRGFGRGFGAGGFRRGPSFGPGRGLGWFNVGYEDYPKDIKAALRARADMLRSELERTEAILSEESQKSDND